MWSAGVEAEILRLLLLDDGDDGTTYSTLVNKEQSKALSIGVAHASSAQLSGNHYDNNSSKKKKKINKVPLVQAPLEQSEDWPYITCAILYALWSGRVSATVTLLVVIKVMDKEELVVGGSIKKSDSAVRRKPRS